MQTRYETLLDQLHTNKRQLSNYRQKYLNMDNELLTTQQENRTLRKSSSQLKQQIMKLTEQNKFMAAQKQALMSDFSTSVESIKEEICKKQHEIYALKQNNYSPLMNQTLLQKQIKCEIESQFQEQLQSKEKKIRQLQQHIDRMNFDRQVQKQKYHIKLQSLQRELKQMQNCHMTELQNYAHKTYHNSQTNKISEEQSLIKKLRRQIDQLRVTLDHNQQELSESISEKNKLQKQHSSFINKHKKQVQNYAEQIRVYQLQNQKLSEVQNRNKNQRDQFMLRQKEKQIKALKDKVEELHQLISKKQSKISEIEVEYVAKSTEVKRLKDFSSKHQNQKIQDLKLQKQSLMRQINELKHSNQNVRKQNIELMNFVSEIQTKSIQNIKQNSNIISRNIIEHNILSTKQINKIRHSSIMDQKYNAQQPNIQLDNSFGHRHTSPRNMKNQTLENQKKYYEKKIEEEISRNKQLSVKYVELKKKFRNLEEKFKEANNKVVELLKNKIVLGSPTAASKKSFEFPTSPNLKYSRSPEPGYESFYDNLLHSKTQGNLGGLLRNTHLSPQNNITHHKRGQRSTSSKGDQSFYQKSLKVKNSHKFKQIKCLNHDDTTFDHRGCSHSPIKINE